MRTITETPIHNYTKEHQEPSAEEKQKAISNLMHAATTDERKKASEEFINAHLWMLTRIADCHGSQYEISRVEKEELVQAAVEPMVESLNNYDISRGDFEPYARSIIPNSLKEEFHRQKLIYLPATARQEGKNLIEYLEEHPTSYEEACKNIKGFKREGAAKAVRLLEVSKKPVSIDYPLGNDDAGEALTLADTLADGFNGEETFETESQKNEKASMAHGLICEVLKDLKPRAALVLILYYNIPINVSELIALAKRCNVASVKGLVKEYTTKPNFSLESIGGHLLNKDGQPVSRQAIDQIHRKALKQAKECLLSKHGHSEIAPLIL